MRFCFFLSDTPPLLLHFLLHLLHKPRRQLSPNKFSSCSGAREAFLAFESSTRASISALSELVICFKINARANVEVLQRHYQVKVDSRAPLNIIASTATATEKLFEDSTSAPTTLAFPLLHNTHAGSQQSGW